MQHFHHLEDVLGPTCFAVATALAAQMPEGTLEWRGTDRQLQAATGFCETTVRKYLRELVALRYLTMERHTKRRKLHITTYRLLLPSARRDPYAPGQAEHGEKVRSIA